MSDVSFTPSAPIGLESGDTVLMVTDGVLEACSPDDIQFGSERLLRVVRKNLHLNAQCLIDKPYHTVEEFSGTNRIEDDLTSLIVKLGPSG
jgi:serine phosphatase RsbU (regulator of sigma subunit)